MLKQRALALFFVWMLFVALVGAAVAGDEPFDGPANWGDGVDGDPHGAGDEGRAESGV